MTTKYCHGCNQEKLKNEFNKNSKKKDGLQTRCRECNKVYLQGHYQDNKKYYHDKKKNFINDLHGKIAEIKEKNPCTDCGEFYPYYVMDFDHIGDDKEMNIANSINYGNWAKIEEEIAKCELVCSNCHRKRTYNRNENHLRNKYL